jgi:hypothetical protein
MKNYYDNAKKFPSNAKIHFTITIYPHKGMYYLLSDDVGPTLKELMGEVRNNQKYLFLNNN